MLSVPPPFVQSSKLFRKSGDKARIGLEGTNGGESKTSGAEWCAERDAVYCFITRSGARTIGRYDFGCYFDCSESRWVAHRQQNTTRNMLPRKRATLARSTILSPPPSSFLPFFFPLVVALSSARFRGNGAQHRAAFPPRKNRAR